MASPTVRAEHEHEYAGHRVWCWVGGWVAIVGLGVAWGAASIADDPLQGVTAAPLTGHWGSYGDPRLLPAILLGVAAVVFGPGLARRLSWGSLLIAAGATATAWTLALAASKGWSRVGSPLDGDFDFLPFASRIESPGEFLRTFVERGPGYPAHVKGHPPGATLVFWVIDHLGLTTAGGAAAVMLVAWGIAVVAVLAALDVVAGRERARQAAPFLALAPAAVWAGTSADALYAAVIAIGVALVARATVVRGPQSMALVASGGVALALALQLTYGAVPLLVLPAGLVAARRRFDLVFPAVAAAAAVTLAFWAVGFWWFDGLAMTRVEYWRGVAADRPWTYYLLAGNPAALALAVGPAVAAGLARVRRADWGRCGLALGGLGAVAIANSSGMSKAEVERIWLPYVPWILTATAWLAAPRMRVWLAANVTLGLVLEAFLRSKW